jgi:hypothetical protein
MAVTKALLSVGLQDAGRGDLVNPAENAWVALPFRKGDLTGTVVSPNGAFSEPNDGTFTALFYSLTASSTWATTATSNFGFSGRVFGLRFSRGADAPISVMIDGVAYPVPYGRQLTPATGVAFGGLMGGAEAILATDLSDGEHLAEIMIPASATAARSTSIFGYICEAKVNPVPPPRGTRFTKSPTAITTSFQTFTATNAYGYRSLHLVNTTVAAITVSVAYAGGTPFAQIIVPANGDYHWDFGLPVYHTLDVKASAVGVNALFGEQN